MNNVSVTQVRRQRQSLRSAEEAELESLYRSHSRKLVSLVFLVVGDIHAAEDIVQEAFYRLHRQMRRQQRPDDMASYLRSIALNLARSWLRRLRVVRKHNVVTVLPVDTPEADFLHREGHTEVVEALWRLPRRQRECTVLRFYMELPEAEIAQALMISTGSVKRHLHRAMAKLTARLGGHHGP